VKLHTDTLFKYKPRDWLEQHLQNDLFCVKWDVKS